MVGGSFYGARDGVSCILFARSLFFGGSTGGRIFHSSGALDTVGNDAIVAAESVVDGSFSRYCGGFCVSMANPTRRIVVAGNFDTFDALSMVSATRFSTIPFTAKRILLIVFYVHRNRPLSRMDVFSSHT